MECLILTLRIFAPWRLCVRLPLDGGRFTQRRKAAKKNRKVRHYSLNPGVLEYQLQLGFSGVEKCPTKVGTLTPPLQTDRSFSAIRFSVINLPVSYEFI